MSYETGYRSTPAQRRQKEAERLAWQQAEDRRQAALSWDEYLAEVAAGYGVTHVSNVAAGEDVDWFRTRHAALVARYGAAA